MAVGVVVDAASSSGMQNPSVLDTYQGVLSSNGKLDDEARNSVVSNPKSSVSLLDNPDANTEPSDPNLKTGKSVIEADAKHRKAKQSALPVDELYHTKRGEWCASMVCYIWFAEASRLPIQQTNTSGTKRKRSDTQTWSSQKGFHRPALSMNSPISSLDDVSSRPSQIQVYPTDRFVSFVIKILRTTQVSYSVVLVSLYYIYRLKRRRLGLVGQHGSEYRLFLTSVLLANKFLDDYTYTNKTWADLSGTPLKEVTKMELQMYAGIGANANVTPSDYAWWCAALKSLKHQREIDLKWLQCKESASCMTRSPLSWSMHLSPISTPLGHTRALPGTQYGCPTTAYTAESPTGQSQLSWPIMDEREERRIQSSPTPMTHGLLENGYALGPLQMPDHISSTDLVRNNNSLWPGRHNHEQGVSERAPRTPVPPHAQYESNGLISSMTDVHYSVPANVDPVVPISDLNPPNDTVSGLQSKPMLDMELFGLYRRFSPPFVSHPSTNTSPIVLAYYQLAAGYPYGIPTSTNVGAVHNRPFFAPHPVFENSKPDMNMFISPPGVDALTQSNSALHIKEPFTHWPGVRMQNIPCGSGDVGVQSESDNSVASVPVQSLVSAGFPSLEPTGQFMGQK